MSDTRSLTQM